MSSAALLSAIINSVYMLYMLVHEDLDSHNDPLVVCESHRESGSVEELKCLDQVPRNAEDPIKAEETVRQKAAWRLRISKREVRMFRLSRAGELAMSTTIAPLGIYAAVHSLSEGRIEGAAFSVIGILWGLGVGRAVIQDLKSPEYIDLVNTEQERMYHNAAMASLEVTP